MMRLKAGRSSWGGRLRDRTRCTTRDSCRGLCEGVNHQRRGGVVSPRNRGVRRVSSRRDQTRRAGAGRIRLKPGDGVVVDIGTARGAGARRARRSSRDSRIKGNGICASRRSECTAGAHCGRRPTPRPCASASNRPRPDRVVHRASELDDVRRIGEPLKHAAEAVRGGAAFRAEESWPGRCGGASSSADDARNRSATSCFRPVGDTPFGWADVKGGTRCGHGARSVMNDLRRQLVAELLRQRERARSLPWPSGCPGLLRNDFSPLPPLGGRGVGGEGGRSCEEHLPNPPEAGEGSKT